MAETVGTAGDKQVQSQHQMVRNGQRASCTCGTWESRTNEVVEADILKTLQKQYSLHLADERSI
jgi:hypothetical protein